MALPRGIRTLQHFVTKAESRPDNVFCTDAILDRLIACDVRTTEQPPHTDHYPIATILDIRKSTNKPKAQPNFKEVDWEAFNEDLRAKMELMGLEEDNPITTEAEFNERVDILTKMIQDTISQHVPTTTPSDYARRWWSKSLTEMRDRKKDLLRQAKQMRAIPGHPIHNELRKHMNEY
ncbi:hypothetical protein FA13DRAFT_1588964, partial [Coprinellus micaceus]